MVPRKARCVWCRSSRITLRFIRATFIGTVPFRAWGPLEVLLKNAALTGPQNAGSALAAPSFNVWQLESNAATPFPYSCDQLTFVFFNVLNDLVCLGSTHQPQAVVSCDTASRNCYARAHSGRVDPLGDENALAEIFPGT